MSKHLFFVSELMKFGVQAGEDASWLRSNAPKFEELAKQGDADFIELVEEMQSRDDLSV